jgi:hypothetical protein
MNVASITDAAMSHGFKLGVQTPGVALLDRLPNLALSDAVLTAL